MKDTDITNLAKLTTISEYSLKRIFNILAVLWCNKVKDDYSDNPDAPVELDIEFGKLYLHIDEEVKYTFVPSDKFNSMLDKTLRSDYDPLIKSLEDNLRHKISSAYKELL